VLFESVCSSEILSFLQSRELYLVVYFCNSVFHSSNGSNSNLACRSSSGSPMASPTLIMAFAAAATARVVVRDRPIDPAPYKTLWFRQQLDHFQMADNTTFMQRYLLNDQHWQPGVGPILFYTGNEGPIDAFYAACGFITDVLAPKLNALIIFGEQRYYGKSLPFGPDSWRSKESLKYLSTEQVLADYAMLLTAIKPNLNASNLPVVSFGGSYGGTLSTFMRLKYPHVVVGALAASAPIGYYSPTYWAERGVTDTTWFSTIVADYSTARPGCYDTLVRAVALANATARDKAGGGDKAVASAFGLCSPPTDVSKFVYWITEALESIPQIDYPEPVGGLPAHPVNATCNVMAQAMRRHGAGQRSHESPSSMSPSSPPALLTALGEVMRWYYGDALGWAPSSTAKAGTGCIPMEQARNPQAGGGIPGDGPQPNNSWGWQSCTENLHAFSVPRGSWRSYTFDLARVSALCAKYYQGVVPQIHWLETW
jgi:pimeloyl-ACP methyl ester carboxylesterase